MISMEDNPVFNAGTGSTLNLLGEVETDAALMDGENLEGAGVALVRGVKNPIRLARIVMERTDHALIAGYGAERIAAVFGLPTANLRVQDRVKTRDESGRIQDGRWNDGTVDSRESSSGSSPNCRREARTGGRIDNPR